MHLLPLAAALLILTIIACGKDQGEAQAHSGVPVTVEAVTYQEVSIPVHSSGKLVSGDEAKLSFKVGGLVGRIPADEGEAVREGQLLAELKLDEIQAQVEAARSAYEKAKRDMERTQRLYGDSAATLEQLQDATTALKVAQSALEIAEFNQAHAVILAPADGRVLKRFVEENELVGPGVPVFLFGSSQKGWTVRVGVTDRDLIRLEIGDSATVTFDAYPGRDLAAVISEIGQAADALTGTYEVKLVVEEGQYHLASGFVAAVDIHPAKCEPMHVVPVEAVMEGDGEDAYVYVPDESGRIARKTAVRVGCLAGDSVAIRSGLEGVGYVITQGAAYLTDNTPIRIVSRPEERK
jgi:multidrug efflux system membrane fusion protein